MGGKSVVDRVVALLTVSLAALAVPGCLEPHATAKAEADQRWRTIRARVKLGLAEEQLRNGSAARALEQLDQVKELDPTLPGLAPMLAKAYLAEGQIPEAEAALREAAAENAPTDAQVNYLLGIIEQRRGAWRRAWGHYAAAAASEPRSLALALAEAEALLHLGGAEEACHYLIERVERFNQEPAFHWGLAEAYRAAGNLDAAAQSYRTARELGEQDPDVTESLAWCLLRAGRFAAAAEEFRHLLAEQGRSSYTTTVTAHQRRLSIELGLAKCLLEVGQPAEARERLAALTRSHEKEPGVWLALARASLACGDTERALKNAVRAAELDEQNVAARQLATYLAVKAGQGELAEQLARQAVAIGPQDAANHILLGWVFASGQDYPRASHCYAKAVELDPGCELASALLLGCPVSTGRANQSDQPSKDPSGAGTLLQSASR